MERNKSSKFQAKKRTADWVAVLKFTTPRRIETQFFVKFPAGRWIKRPWFPVQSHAAGACEDRPARGLLVVRNPVWRKRFPANTEYTRRGPQNRAENDAPWHKHTNQCDIVNLNEPSDRLTYFPRISPFPGFHLSPQKNGDMMKTDTANWTNRMLLTS